MIAFASERFILQRVLDDKELQRQLGDVRLEQIRAGHALAISLDELRAARVLARRPSATSRRSAIAPNGHQVVDRRSQLARRSAAAAARSASCPRRFRSSSFDEHGVCRYCRTWKPIQPKGERGAARRGRAVPQQGRQPRRDRRVLAAAAIRRTACTT